MKVQFLEISDFLNRAHDSLCNAESFVEDEPAAAARHSSIAIAAALIAIAKQLEDIKYSLEGIADNIK